MTAPEPGGGLDGVLPLDKPAGLTSHDAVARVRRLLRGLKVGHTGTLDPQATGLLPLVVGPSTRLSRFLSAARKTYRGTIRLGAATDTGDADGEVIETRPVPDVSPAELAAAMSGLTGLIHQTPPMYSALKVDGIRLYARARRGETVERAARPVRVYRFALLAIELPDITIEVECGSGTYVRVLAEDLARTLGTAGHLQALKRVAVGPFRESDAVPLAELRGPTGLAALRQALVPPARALAHLPAVQADWSDRRPPGRGTRLRILAWDEAVREPDARYVRVVAPDGQLIGLGEPTPIDKPPETVYGLLHFAPCAQPAPWVRIIFPLAGEGPERGAEGTKESRNA